MNGSGGSSSRQALNAGDRLVRSAPTRLPIQEVVGTKVVGVGN